MLTQQRLQQLFDYNPNTGIFIWKKLPHQFSYLKLGTQAGHVVNGEVIIGICGKAHRASRLAFCYMHGRFPEYGIGFADGDSTNCSINNLIETPRRNPKASGASFHKANRNWVASISINNRRKYLGSYPTKQAAEASYRAALSKLEGGLC